ncbi:MAG: metallophosphoesterase [Candidatus Thermoplasmatota archaeon]|jgi:3',5'-cyclic AMP phosphodiesterase CpdA|nr:metallophosphoesterase [Candidatus Thermoplasmatota archaeon]
MRIAHISDIHFNFGTDFNEKVYEKAVKILNKINPDLVFISGDITTDGLLSEYDLANEKLKEINFKQVVVPGNHDERNLGFKLFREFFGKTDFIKTFDQVNLVALSSSEPDKDDGRLGRGRHEFIERAIKKKNKMTFVGFHHHLVPVPNSGREANIIEDAGETLDIILRNKIPLVLMGHRHVPWAVKIHKTLLVNAGTFSCNRTRAHLGNTFNVIDINKDIIEITVVNIRKEKFKKMIDFNTQNGFYLNKNYD